jgi:hypothetical protein
MSEAAGKVLRGIFSYCWRSGWNDMIVTVTPWYYAAKRFLYLIFFFIKVIFNPHIIENPSTSSTALFLRIKVR